MLWTDVRGLEFEDSIGPMGGKRARHGNCPLSADVRGRWSSHMFGLLKDSRQGAAHQFIRVLVCNAVVQRWVGCDLQTAAD